MSNFEDRLKSTLQTFRPLGKKLVVFDAHTGPRPRDGFILDPLTQTYRNNNFKTCLFSLPIFSPLISKLISCLGGEPLRIIVEGFEGLQGATILEKRRDAMNRFDWARRALMREPRGHNGTANFQEQKKPLGSTIM